MICPTCEKNFTTLSNLYRHLRVVHRLTNYTEVTKSSPLGLLRFDEIEQFKDWKRKVEEEDGAFFVINSTKKIRDGKKSYYFCNRSGSPRVEVPPDKRKRRCKAGGSNKINGICTARFTARFTRQGVLVTDFHRGHSGHECELIHLPIPHPKKKRITAKFGYILNANRSKMTGAGLPVELPLEDEVLREIVEKSKDWGLMHGVAIRPFDAMDPNTLTIAPHTLFPTPIPRKDFQELIRLQPALNLLMHKVAHDHSFLEQALGNTVQYDEFTRKTYEIYEIVRKEGFTQDVSLGLFRSDYLPDSIRSLYLQVEFNTISTSIASLASHITQLQSYILAELGYSPLLENMPENNALSLMSLGLVKAWEHYGNEKAVIIFLVEDVTANICDQRFMEYEIRRVQPKIKVVRVQFSNPANFRLGRKKELLVNDQEVAVVYYRTAYSPSLYKEGDWETRLLIERSTAVKCPSVQYQLAGTKKVQQVLALPGTVEKFVEDPGEAKAIRKLFTELHSLDLNEEGDKAYNLALQLPENFVLKPQREGGGNNIYGKEIPNFLKSLGKERQAYILMGLISPQSTQNYLVSRASGPVPALETIVSELGIYGVILGSSKDVLTNYQAGHMLRSKLSTSNEGGLAVGSGYLDSPYLV